MQGVRWYGLGQAMTLDLEFVYFPSRFPQRPPTMLFPRPLIFLPFIVLLSACDSWETKHLQEIMQGSQDASLAALIGRNFEAVEKADKVIALVGERKLNSPSAQQALAEAKKAKSDAESKIQAFMDKREQVEAQLAAGEYGASAASCDGLLEMLKGQTHAEAFIATVEKMRAEAQGKEAERAEQVRQAEIARQREEADRKRAEAERLAKEEVARRERELLEIKAHLPSYAAFALFVKQARDGYAEGINLIRHKSVVDGVITSYKGIEGPACHLKQLAAEAHDACIDVHTHWDSASTYMNIADQKIKAFLEEYEQLKSEK